MSQVTALRAVRCVSAEWTWAAPSCHLWRSAAVAPWRRCGRGRSRSRPAQQRPHSPPAPPARRTRRPTVGMCLDEAAQPAGPFCPPAPRAWRWAAALRARTVHCVSRCLHSCGLKHDKAESALHSDEAVDVLCAEEGELPAHVAAGGALESRQHLSKVRLRAAQQASRAASVRCTGTVW